MKTKHESDGAHATGTTAPPTPAKKLWRKPVIRRIGQTIYTQTGSNILPGQGENTAYMPVSS